MKLRPTVVVALAVTLVTAACTPLGSHSAAPATPPAQALDWRGCGHGESFQAGAAVKGAPECAYLTVPTDYAHPAAGNQSLAVTRVRAAGRRQGVLFVNPGGPGAPATSMVKDLVGAMSPQVTDAFDIVAMDPRVVGASGYLSCTDPQARNRTTPLDATPENPTELAALKEGLTRLGASCAQRQPSLIAHLGTPDFARDLDTLRSALGVERLDLLTYSYGTVLAYEYARMFPGRLHRMVLDGPVVPGRTPAVRALAKASTSEDTLYQFAVACADEKCTLGSTADSVIGAVRAMQRKLERAPVTIPGHDPLRPAVDAGAFTAVVFSALYSPDLAFELPAVMHALGKGDPAPFVSLADKLENSPGHVGNSVVNGAFWGTSCLDEPRIAITPGARAEIEDASETFGVLLATSAELCDSWPVPAQPLVGTTLSADIGARTLIVSNASDPATPRSEAIGLRARIPGSALLEVDIWGHTATFEGLSCVDAAVTAFLVSGDRRPASRTCGPD